MNIRVNLLSIWIFTFPICLSGQFQNNGTATAVSDSCFQFTPAGNFTGGSFWHTDEISLLEDFDISVDINFGCEDGQGDGVVFSLQAIGAYLGSYNGTLGYEGIAPTFGIEIDTKQEEDFGDPVYDHIAIITDGNLNHDAETNITGPVRALPDVDNIEDCNFHHLRVTWQANNRLMKVYFDCVFRLQMEQNISDQFLAGQDEVFWGLTSASDSNDLHEICVSMPTQIDEQADLRICKGDEIQLQTRPGEVNYFWTPGNSLSDSLIANPVANPEITTVYSVLIEDECGKKFIDEVLVEVTDIGIELDLGSADTLLCSGEILELSIPETDLNFLWNTGQTDLNILVSEAGFYSINVWNTECEIQEEIVVSYFDEFELDLGGDTVICGDLNFEIASPITGESYTWQDGSTMPSLSVNNSGIYSLEIDHRCGVLSDSLAVSFEDCFLFFAPNAFSPNGDGENEVFTLYAGDEVDRIVSLSIFDRWGAAVFEARDIIAGDESSGWRGDFKGVDVAAGVYIWVAEIDFTFTENEIRSGSVTLMR